MDYVIGGLAGMAGGLVSNPFELIKIRQQLQGELQAATQSRHHRPYATIWTSIKTIARAEGILALQKGLLASSMGQFTLHGTRLGLYGLLEQMQWTSSSSTAASMGASIVFGSLTGFLGALVASPFIMIKTQIQSQSPGATAVGFQHNYTGTANAFNRVYRRHGPFGFWHGFQGFGTRITVVLGMQMMTFDAVKRHLQQQQYLAGDAKQRAIVASLVSAMICCVSTTPFDVIATRLHNQGVDKNGRGLFYRNIFDCCAKIVRVEGVAGLFKGFAPICFKQAPHTVVTLTTWEWLKKMRTPSMPRA